ncbi:hypothetical protein M2475_001817 [Breznakia sp. PF5-3]|uniref:hypothetical protein n=1 Tax=unclassified Breznakia TaxID=2623764 RepID=UPI0024067A2D|nr:MULTISPECIES: hypothetical protein [unclassified Breznakia]MDF9825362.1 hypothetical protein [Breznakia sp. PM6-1]MDF9836240.1 hypothetical protein [Breznakia sp. PF5-3]MDF9838520.1 hypothetical protein [Breznakia sp. PFB2-8]MDF9860485.1 hypothetical protein [Breznakia sp. PH5-24]
MKNQITQIINNWNPIEIQPLLEDEYEPEIEKIVEWLILNKRVDSIKLAQYIGEVFIKYFGISLYKIDERKVLSVAEEIIQIKSDI